MFFKSVFKNQLFICILITILGLYLVYGIYNQTSLDIREEMLIQAMIIAQSFDVENIKALSGTSEDLNKEEFIVLQKYLSDVIKLNPQYRFLTIIGRNEYSELFFLNFVGYDELGNELTVLPGTIYSTTAQMMLNIFHIQESRVFGPNVDNWGKFLTTIIPIIDQESGIMIALFTMDYDYNEVRKMKFDKILFPVLLLILLNIITFILFKLHISRKKITEQSQRILKQREAINQLALNFEYGASDFLSSIDNLCEIASETANIDRVSVWTMREDGNALYCESVYDMTTKSYSRGHAIYGENFPNIHEIFQQNNLIALTDIQKDNDFKPFCDHYIKIGTGFKSVIFSIIKQDRNIIGALILATHTHYRTWTSDEKAFVDTLTALLGQIFDRERKEKAEQELIDTNLRFINTLENIEDGYIYLDEKYICKFINYQAYKILSLKSELLVNRDIWTVLPDILSTPMKAIVENAMAEDKTTIKTEYIAEINKWIEFKVYPSNKDISIFMVDVSKIKQAEQAFIDNHRLSVIGEMAYSFAHDFNNFLQVILSNIQILENKLASENYIKNYVDTIYRTTNDAAVRVQLLQRFAGSRNKKSEYEVVNLNKITQEAIIQAMSIWKTDAERNGISVEIKENYEDLPDINGNDGELRTAIYNMIKNSVEAMSNNGIISFETNKNEQGVYLLISDTGCGIKSDKFSQIFEPFYSTKSLDIGKGLGLSFVYNVMTEHKGNVKVVSSSAEKGTTFELFLPYFDPSETEEQDPTNKKIIQKPKIMWVDDDSMIRETAEEMMNIIGYDVDMAEGGEEALELFKNKKYDILLSDIGMPKMNGWQLVEKVNELYRENLKVALITGWGDQITEAQKKQYQIDYVLSKPVKIQQLQKLIEDFLK
ncbi:MAG: response regulator [Candidatus Cloacimonetes bacterium]|nr:response regulator [Candidatus Cloacimonadota bacterium]